MRKVLLCVVSVFLSSHFALAQVPEEEREALIALYNSTDGPNWENNDNWLGPVGTECTWYGVWCYSAFVDGLNLPDNGLTGEIPPELGNLTRLWYLDLSYNELAGIIPPEIGELNSLDWLDLQGSELSGNIPPELGNLSNLYHMNLGGNRLTGNIPPELGRLAENLGELFLQGNELSGAIPTELTELNVLYLYLGNNQLTGSIPAEIGGMRFWDLSLQSNRLSGEIPAELGALSGALFIDLSSNQLSGSIPAELGQLTGLFDLDLSFNQLTGVIPGDLGGMLSLQALDLSHNMLSGEIPAELGDLIYLASLDLSCNALEGSIPPELGNLWWLRFLYLQSNRLRGSIPLEIGDLSNLAPLNLSPPWPTRGLDLRWNCLYSGNTALVTFLNSKGGDWQSTQTVAPENLMVDRAGDHTVWLRWDAVSYTADPGGYKVFAAPTGTEFWFSGGRAADKTTTIFPFTGLDPATTYDFAVSSYTEEHFNNQNFIESDIGSAVLATTNNEGCVMPVIEVSRGWTTTLSVVGSYDEYLWSTGEETPSIIIDPELSQWYWVAVTSAGPCEESAAIWMDSLIFTDNFESGNTSRWSGTVE